MAMISPSESYLFGIKPSCLFGGGSAKLSLTDQGDPLNETYKNDPHPVEKTVPAIPADTIPGPI